MRSSAVLLVTAALVLGSAFPASAARSEWDRDGDGYDDMTELAFGYSPYGEGRLDESDADGDGLTDGDEIAFKSDPLVADSDGDGWSDGYEVQNAYDPAVASPARLKKHILIDISEQKLTYFLGPKAIATHPVSTGRRGHPTPRGTFKVLNKLPRAWSRSAKLWMPYWMPFIGTTYGIHELPEWPGGKKEGENHLGTPVSGGCIRLGVGAAKKLYDWAEIGTEIVIQD